MGASGVSGTRRNRRAASDWRNAGRTEQDVQRAILQYLAARRIYAWRVNTGAARFPGKDGRPQLVRFGRVGTPDIQGVIKEQGGRAIYIEVKRPGQPLTAHQDGMLAILRREGALAFVARSIEDVAEALAGYRSTVPSRLG